MNNSIVYEDNHVLVAIKPQNKIIHKNNKNEGFLYELKEYLADRESKESFFLDPISRLDKAVGGLCVFAKTSKAKKRLDEKSLKNELENKYLSVVVSYPRFKKTILKNFLKLNKDLGKLEIVPSGEENAIKAETSYTLLQNKEKISLLEVEADNYIAHQIRAQLSLNKTPVFGDAIYGGDIVKGWGLALWLYKVKFEHPVSGKKLTFICSPDQEQTPWKHFSLDKYLKVEIS